MWREMLAATVKMQSPLSVAVFTPPHRQGFWDLARDHYGSNTPMVAYPSFGQVVGAVAGGQTSLGVLPLPEANEADPWWPDLLSVTGDGPRILARLPFGARGNARGDNEEALVIGLGPPQKSGLDRTFLAAECAPDVTRARMLNLLTAVGLMCTSFLQCQRDIGLNLIEIDDFVPMSDPRLDTFRAELGPALGRLLLLGGYATPLSPAALAAG